MYLRGERSPTLAIASQILVCVESADGARGDQVSSDDKAPFAFSSKNRLANRGECGREIEDRDMTAVELSPGMASSEWLRYTRLACGRLVRADESRTIGIAKLPGGIPVRLRMPEANFKTGDAHAAHLPNRVAGHVVAFMRRIGMHHIGLRRFCGMANARYLLGRTRRRAC